MRTLCVAMLCGGPIIADASPNRRDAAPNPATTPPDLPSTLATPATRTASTASPSEDLLQPKCEKRAAEREIECRSRGASPFACLRFGSDGSVRVQVDGGGAWHGLAALDGVCVDSILEAARQGCTDGDRRWQKRVAEDLESVMSLVGVELGRTASVSVIDPTTRRTRTLSDVSVTKAKRAAARSCWSRRDD